MNGQTVRQLKKLQLIKPDKDWVILTKRRILGASAVRELEGRGMIGWLKVPRILEGLKVPRILEGLSDVEKAWRLALGRHTAAVTVLSAMVIFLSAGLGFMGYQNKNLKDLIAELSPRNNNGLSVSLMNVQKSLESINASLDNLKTAKSPDQALAMTEVVKATAQRGSEIISNIKRSPNTAISKDVLASLEAVEKASSILGEKSATIQKDLLASYLQDLKQRALSAEDAERLLKAEEYLQQGKEAEALVLLTRIGSQ